MSEYKCGYPRMKVLPDLVDFMILFETEPEQEADDTCWYRYTTEKDKEDIVVEVFFDFCNPYFAISAKLNKRHLFSLEKGSLEEIKIHNSKTGSYLRCRFSDGACLYYEPRPFYISCW